MDNTHNVVYILQYNVQEFLVHFYDDLMIDARGKTERWQMNQTERWQMNPDSIYKRHKR